MKPLFILGATASGKTGAALEAALRRGGEIVGADSVQIYRGLVIGSAAPSEAEMALVPHHLIGTEELGNEINAGIYIKKAKAAISDIIGRGRLPIVVGGTNFYVDALLNGLSPVPEIDAGVKAAVDAKCSGRETSELFEELVRTDPVWAGQISSCNDRQRILRGLEVFAATGLRLSDWNKMERTGGLGLPCALVGIDIEREKLYERINLRASQMVENGVVDEVRRVRSLGFSSQNCKALRSIGYIETEMYLNGEIPDTAALVEEIARNTRHLAKRQLTWLRGMKGVVWAKHEEIQTVIDDIYREADYDEIH
ncbi:tRNA (adenosine(37)-N6)-dimethylallyltransferase MiaA [bacterium]|nr:tRNA (adenosine(37)-N6)-dimethylallyltransferase MiaA [bacterium]